MPTTQSNASLLALLEQYLQDGIPVDPDLLMQAMMAQTPGVGDGVIGTSLVANGSGAPLDLSSLLSACNGLLDNLGAVTIQLSAGLSSWGTSLSAPAATAPADGGGTGNSTADLINSLYQVRADLVAPAVALVGLEQSYGAQTQVLLAQLASNPEGAGAVFGEMLGNLVVNALPSAQRAFATLAATGNTGPLIAWAVTYGPAAAGLGEGAAGLAEVGAEAVTTEAGALAGEAPAWAAEGEALGAPAEQIESAAEESAALNVAAEAEEAAVAEGAVAPLTDPIEAGT